MVSRSAAILPRCHLPPPSWLRIRTFLFWCSAGRIKLSGSEIYLSFAFQSSRVSKTRELSLSLCRLCLVDRRANINEVESNNMLMNDAVSLHHGKCRIFHKLLFSLFFSICAVFCSGVKDKSSLWGCVVERWRALIVAFWWHDSVWLMLKDKFTQKCFKNSVFSHSSHKPVEKSAPLCGVWTFSRRD